MLLSDAVHVIFDNAQNLFSAEALLQYQEKLNNLIADRNKAIATAVNPGAISAELRSLRALLPFFIYIESHRETEKPFYVWFLDWQLSTWNDQLTNQAKHLLSVALDHFMKNFLALNDQAAIDYYQEHQAMLDKASPLVKSRLQNVKSAPKAASEIESVPVPAKTLVDWQHYFDKMLQGQVSEPAAILPLAMHYYDEPNAFAAIVLWLLAHHVKPQVIVHSGLLHRVFLGHVADLGNEVNALATLYQQLKTSSAAGVTELIGLAEKTSSCIINDEKKEVLRGFNGYDLTGRVHEGEQQATLTILSTRQMINLRASIVLHPENIRALSEVFSHTFLRLLASVPAVANSLTEEQWQDYLMEAMPRLKDDLASFPVLFDLYSLMQRYQPSLKVKVFLQIIDLAFTFWHQIDADNDLVNKIKSLFDELTTLGFFGRINRQIELLNACIAANTYPLTQSGYYVIEDAWKEMARYVGFAHALYAHPEYGSYDFPKYLKDIFALQVAVLQHCPFEEVAINFDAMLGHMLPSQLKEEDALSHEKSLLLEWLTKEQNESSQNFIIDRLINKFQVDVRWSVVHQGKSLFRQSCKAGNLPFVERLMRDQEDTPDQEQIGLGLRDAANFNAVGVFQFLLNIEGDNAADEEQMNVALIDAVLSRSLAVVSCCFDPANELVFDTSILAHVVRDAAVGCDDEAFNILLPQWYEALEEVGDIADWCEDIDAVWEAIGEGGSLNMAISLIGLKNVFFQRPETLTKVLVAALARRHEGMAIYLLGLENIKIPCSFLHAFTASVTHGLLSVFEFLLNSRRADVLNGNAIHSGLRLAISAYNYHVFTSLLNVGASHLIADQHLLNNVLLRLLEERVWVWMVEFCSLMVEYTPSHTISDNIIATAIDEHKLDVAVFLCKHWNGRISKKALATLLEAAIIENKLDCVAEFCRSIEPDRIPLLRVFSWVIEHHRMDVLQLILQLPAFDSFAKMHVGNLLRQAICVGDVDIFINIEKRYPGKIFTSYLSDGVSVREIMVRTLYGMIWQEMNFQECRVFAVWCRLRGKFALNDDLIAAVFRHVFRQDERKKAEFARHLCGLGDHPVPNDVQVAALLRYALNRNHAVLVDCFIKEIISKQGEIIRPAILDYFVFLLKDKFFVKKYQVLSGFYKKYLHLMSVEKAAAIFDLINQNADVLNISVMPGQGIWEPAFIKRNKVYVHAWPSAWGVIRELIFHRWQVELNSEQTTPERKQALIALFEGCGEPDGPHHKLMGMGRTSGKPHSKTSRLIEDEIAKVRGEPAPRPY